MSTNLGESPAGTILTSFSGGELRGLCCRVESHAGATELTLEDAEFVADTLYNWVESQREADLRADPPQRSSMARQIRLEVKVPHSDPIYRWGTRVKFVFPIREVPDLEKARELVGLAFGRFAERLAVCLSEPHPEDK